jgi:nicotinamidase-related amidase
VQRRRLLQRLAAPTLLTLGTSRMANATRSEARKTAVLVVDAQVGVLASVWQREAVVGRIEHLVRKARAAGVAVLWLRHGDDELKRGSAPWQLAPPFVPAAGEPVIDKRFNSSFAATDLQQHLAAAGARRVVLAGAATNWCIRATAYAALERGYDLAVAADAHSTEDLPLGDGRRIAAADIVAEFNAVIRWTSAPQSTVEVAAVADLVL